MLVPPTQAALHRRWPRTQVCGSVLLVVSGCIVAGFGDLGFDAPGYMYALLSCITQAAYLLVVEFQVRSATLIVGMLVSGRAMHHDV